MFLSEVGCGEEYQIQVAEDHVHSTALVLVTLILKSDTCRELGTVTDVAYNTYLIWI
jgi:hypothetical protein